MMRFCIDCFLVFAGWLVIPQWACAVSPIPEEMAEARRFAAVHFEGKEEPEPALENRFTFGKDFFSFTYDGKSAGDCLGSWDLQRESQAMDENRTRHTLTYTDPNTGVVFRCAAVEYRDFPAVEWTLYFKNSGDKDTPILENIQGLNMILHRGEDGEFILRGSQGDACMPDSYAPYEQVMVHNMRRRFAPDGGRPCDMAFPYFNVAGPGGGVILAIGWTGQWSAFFQRNQDKDLRITAGQELTRFYLKPGEEVRSPLMVLLFWKGEDAVRSQNLWRRWMLTHNVPRQLGDKPLRPILTYCTYGTLRWGNNNEQIEKFFIDELAKQEALPDYWWMDAGWFPGGQGQWMVDRDRFPNGLKAISDYVHERNMGLIAWFESESAYPWSITAKSNPDALLKIPWDPSLQYIVNLGEPSARQWLTDCIDKLIHEEGIDVYRQDFNMAPLGRWRANDAEDRQGITENLHVQGYLAFWDELLRRNPKLWIDSCAGGGRRNDLETLRRAVPLLRSDYQDFYGHPSCDNGNQGHTYGIASWFPYFGHNMMLNMQQYLYQTRSYMCPAFGIQFDIRKNEVDWDIYRRLIRQWRQVADCYLGDYYPMTPYSLLTTDWIAWQFHRPDQPDRPDGMIQAFRREKCSRDSLQIKPNGLEADATYTLTNLDVPGNTEMTGRDLMEKGLVITIQDQPGSAIITYKKLSTTDKK